MFGTKSLFSGVYCPSEHPCNLPRCIFKHRELDTDLVRPVAASKNDQSFATNNDRSKRRRLSLEAEENPALKKSTPGVRESSINQMPTSQDPVEIQKKTVATVKRQISPPPLRRTIENSKSSPAIDQKSSSVSATEIDKKHGQTIKPASTAASRDLTSLSRKPEKKEALNPRALKSSPASHTLRFQLVKALHVQLVRLNSELANDANDSERKLVLSDQALITKVLDIEEDAAAKPSIYSNIVKNSILNYKRMTVAGWKKEREKELADLEALQTLASSKSQVSKDPGPSKPIETGLTPKQELALLPRLYTPIEGLSKHGYVSSIPSDEDINTAKLGVEASKGWEVCDRCKSRFQVFPGRREEDGALTSGGSCRYHFGKLFLPERSMSDVKSRREKRYGCCGQTVGDSPGCTQSDTHVFKITEPKRLAAVLNFEKTPTNSHFRDHGPVCMDAEMGYTTYGLELIRLTATSWFSGKELLDVLVRPMGEILDLNSRYSGVWPKDMAEAKPLGNSPEMTLEKVNGDKNAIDRKLSIVDSPASARSLLFSYLSPQTPLIGHGLENDLNATRIIHPTIVDTALLFPHKAGLPFRHSLKMLVQTHLKRDIQVVVDGNMTGHDSKEDAVAAGDLVRYALGREWAKLNTRGWIFNNDKLVPPEQKPQPATTPKAAHSVDPLEKDQGPGSYSSQPPRKRARTEADGGLEEGEVDNH